MPDHTPENGTGTRRPALTGLAFFIDQALPQTQCTRCGYPDCASYAHALAQGTAHINQCPPGGQEGIQRLAALTGQPVQPLNPQCGVEGPLTVARIDENWCIGCTLCIQACPVDAIVGASKHMHTVMPQHCTGCELCLPACPVDCIQLDVVTPGQTGWQAWTASQAAHARKRYAAHQTRISRQTDPQPHNTQPPPPGTAAPQPGDAHTPATSPLVPSTDHPPHPADPAPAPPPPFSSSPNEHLTAHKKAAITAALAKARALRQHDNHPLPGLGKPD